MASIREIEKNIALHIISAQYYSDMAKSHDSEYYKDKDFHIKEALNLICKSKTSNFRFTVTFGGITPYLVYFTIKTPEGKYQVSFHSFADGLGRYTKKTQKTYWDKKSSRKGSIMAAYHYGIMPAKVKDILLMEDSFERLYMFSH